MQDGRTTWWFLVRFCSAWWVVKFGRILRVFKLLRFMDEAQMLGRALKASARRIGVFLFFVFFGFASGMPYSAVSATLAEMYGTRYLGEVKAIFLPLGVFSSALSPMVMGMLIDMGYGMGVLMGLNIALALLAQAGGAMMLGKPPRLAIS